jgi:hypothetical protein
MPRPRFAQQIEYVALAELRPDPKNPRFSPRRLSGDASDDERLRYIARRLWAEIMHCQVERIEPAGDHALVLGEVVSIAHGGG